MTATDIDAQRRTRDRDRDRDRKEDTDVLSNIYHSMGTTVSLFNRSFLLGGKYTGGYKLHDRFSAGITGKFFYLTSSQINGSEFSYGAGAFARAKITHEFYFQAEYDVTSYMFNNVRDIHRYPLIGGGVERGQGGPWTFGANVLLVLDQEVRTINATGVVEYWITFTYNF